MSLSGTQRVFSAVANDLTFFHYKFLVVNNRGNVKTFCITFVHGFNMISISAQVFKAKKIPCGFAII